MPQGWARTGCTLFKCYGKRVCHSTMSFTSRNLEFLNYKNRNCQSPQLFLNLFVRLDALFFKLSCHQSTIYALIPFILLNWLSLGLSAVDRLAPLEFRQIWMPHKIQCYYSVLTRPFNPVNRCVNIQFLITNLHTFLIILDERV